MIVEDGIPKTSLAAGERTRLGAFSCVGGGGSVGEGCAERTTRCALPWEGIRLEFVGGVTGTPSGVEDDDRVVDIGREIFDQENRPWPCLANSSDPPRRPCLLPKLEKISRLRDAYGNCGDGAGRGRGGGCDIPTWEVSVDLPPSKPSSNCEFRRSGFGGLCDGGAERGGSIP